MAKEKLTAGLQGLLTPQTEPATSTPGRTKKNHTITSYSLPVDLIEDIKYIAYYDRKTASSVIEEALRAYRDSWQPAPQLKPRKLTK